MKIVLLGTGSPIPDPSRAGPSTLVTTSGARLLVDCGRGVLMRLAGAGILPPMLSAVLLTHLHSDHITDLSDVITTQWVMSTEPTPLRIVGPPATGDVVDATLQALEPDISYRMNHHDDLTWRPVVEVTEVGPGDELTLASANVLIGATDHRPVEQTVAYRVSDEARSVVLAGDGVPCATLDKLCQGVDAYVQTVLREELIRAIPNRRLQDILEYHSSVTQAAQTAARAGVGTLVLTHYIPGIGFGSESEWISEAKQHFSGQVVVGDDLTTVEL